MSTNSQCILVNQTLTEEVLVFTNGNPKRGLLKPQLFNIIIDEITIHAKNGEERYPLTTGKTKIVCYADAVVIMTENEDYLQ